MITQQSVVTIAPDRLASELEGEMVVLDLKSGAYYGLNEVGTDIWKAIEEPKSVSEVIEIVVTKYDVEKEQCKQDTIALLQELEATGLIEVKDAAMA
ncbi:lasso peptide biosynthesis PqqD family chaperone [Oscillatoriales cyanobacterium LEGE 11467]|uniref:Lasso peptide biosynthesis PqqD family chaperone n=1 Tax=Zarconia navalis LEGE 11467 TaxID=1828826 RepID=A0A928W0Z7_9CYAN|nr:lasso peptide biosynthesis PqqD family chaperone [Zarconia navalis]MBE9041280.1 lasso peptide biosynthesis PqqD family chaperone [Zarconia navalis LEGE 11467]